ncbi:MAG: hypothetical protein HY751_08135 [Nitrospinae bacterium]|nr:hypothetical protein [Nitrospinota bacterium]
MRSGVRVERNAAFSPGRHNAIRVGLSHVKGLSKTLIGATTGNRLAGRYSTVEDFLSRARPDMAEAEALINSGALDCFGHTRPELLWIARLWRAAGRNRPAPHDGLFAETGQPPFAPDIPRIADYPAAEKLRMERETLGFTASAHPLRMFRLHPADRIIHAADLINHVGETVTLAGWLVTAKRTRTVHGQFMKFLTLEDETDIFEATLFPSVYARYGHLLTGRGPYLVTGVASQDHEDLTVTVESVKPAGHGTGAWQAWDSVVSQFESTGEILHLRSE